MHDSSQPSAASSFQPSNPHGPAGKINPSCSYCQLLPLLDDSHCNVQMPSVLYFTCLILCLAVVTSANTAFAMQQSRSAHAHLCAFPDCRL